MSQYRAPLAEMQFVLNELAGLEQVAQLPGYEDAAPDTAAAILEEAAKFATDALDPLNIVGDRHGSKWLGNGNVPTAPGVKAAYAQYCENGWMGRNKSPEFACEWL